MYETELHGLATGHVWLAVCCALYLAWWCVFFRPRAQSPQGLEYGIGVALILGAVAAGILAVVCIGPALSALPSAIPAIVLWPCAIAAYIVLAMVTLHAFNRPITTELLLIVGWTALEVGIAGAIAAAGQPRLAAVLLVLVVIACIGSLVCYVLYYRLADWSAFFDGCGPLVAIGLYSVAFAVIV